MKSIQEYYKERMLYKKDKCEHDTLSEKIQTLTLLIGLLGCIISLIGIIIYGIFNNMIIFQIGLMILGLFALLIVIIISIISIYLGVEVIISELKCIFK